MIIFLTLCYCGLVFLLVKLGVIKLTLWWKISPLVWMVLLLIVLFLPMQFAAPSGTVNVYQPVVEIIPNVSGEVIDVPVEGLVPLEKGDVLFRIDQVPFQATVDRLEAERAQAVQNVERMQVSVTAAAATVVRTEEEMEVIKAEQESAAAAVAAAEAAVEEARAKRDQAATMVADLKLQLTFAASERDRIRDLVSKDAATKSDLDRIELNYTNLESQLNSADADVKAADQTVLRSEADVQAAKASARTVDVRLQQLSDAQLESAEYDLEQTTVTAPSDGFVIGATLRPGQRVTNFPVRSWMAFVDSSKTTMAVGINQYALRHVKPGQKVEVTLKLYPGETYRATVEKIGYITPSGQLAPSGTVAQAPTAQEGAIPFGVVLSLDDDDAPPISDLPGGAVGTAAIYTDVGQVTHVIRRVMIRMEAWMNYVVPL